MADVNTVKAAETAVAMLELDYPLLAEGLLALTNTQRGVSSLVENFEGTPTKEQIASTVLAMIVETSELGQELNWKPWKKVKDIDVARVTDEFADILAFLGLLMVHLQRMGIEPGHLAEAYRKKTKVNLSRLKGEVQGYGKP